MEFGPRGLKIKAPSKKQAPTLPQNNWQMISRFQYGPSPNAANADVTTMDPVHNAKKIMAAEPEYGANWKVAPPQRKAINP